MIEFGFIVILAGCGLCFWLQYKADWLVGGIRKRIDFFDRMLKCGFCTGFHCGNLMYLLSWFANGVFWISLNAETFVWAEYKAQTFAYLVWLLIMPVFGFATSISCYGISVIVRFLENQEQLIARKIKYYELEIGTYDIIEEESEEDPEYLTEG